MKTLKQNNCPGLSGKNTLTYEIGLEHDKSIWLRLIKSSGGGFLSKEWISIEAIVGSLKGEATPFTSYVLHTHFAGKSINSPSFLMAVLKHEGVVISAPDKPQAFVENDFDVAKFQRRMLKAAPKKKKAPKKARKK